MSKSLNSLVGMLWIIALAQIGTCMGVAIVGDKIANAIDRQTTYAPRCR